MAVVLVSALCVCNIFLWFLFFKKFTKLFSTNDIIENTRSELNKLILDVNRNAERDITLINDRIKALKEIVAEADKRISLVSAEAEKKNRENVYRQAIDTAAAGTASRAAREYRRNAAVPGSSHPSAAGQSDLFEQPTVSADGPEVHISDNPVTIKKDFNTLVQERYVRGETVEEIAAALSRSITEVQFALDMNE